MSKKGIKPSTTIGAEIPVFPAYKIIEQNDNKAFASKIKVLSPGEEREDRVDIYLITVLTPFEVKEEPLEEEAMRYLTQQHTHRCISGIALYNYNRENVDWSSGSEYLMSCAKGKENLFY